MARDPGVGAWQGLTAEEQLRALATLSPTERQATLEQNHVALQLTFAWWVREPASRFGLSEPQKRELLEEVLTAWPREFPLLGAAALQG